MNMFIRDLSRSTGVNCKTIRYYESIGLLPRPRRAANNYRSYARTDVERLRFIVAARSLGFSLEDVGEFLKARDQQKLPCTRVMKSLDARVQELEQRIAELLELRETLRQLQQHGAGLPEDKLCGEDCLHHARAAWSAGSQKISRKEGVR